MSRMIQTYPAPPRQNLLLWAVPWTSLWILTAGFLPWGCGNTEDPPADEHFDGSLVPDQFFAGSGQDQAAVVDAPTASPSPDQGAASPGKDSGKSTTPKKDQGSSSSGNSSVKLGKICTSSAGCPTGELCIFMEYNAQKGMCHRTCNTPNQPCSVPDKKFFSPCISYFNSQIGKSINICAVFCQWQGKTYPCPNSVDYKCVSKGSGIKICMPK
jgi:hypothetical protein